MFTGTRDVVPTARSTRRRRSGIAVSTLALVLAALPLTGCAATSGGPTMRAWLKDQSAVAAVDVYCTSYMETGCNLHADVTLVSDTSAEDAAAVIDGALEKAVQDSRVTAGYFNIGLEWQYHST